MQVKMETAPPKYSFLTTTLKSFDEEEKPSRYFTMIDTSANLTSRVFSRDALTTVKFVHFAFPST